MREVTFMENIFVNAPISCDNLRRDGGSCCYILCFSLSYFDEINNRHGMAIWWLIYHQINIVILTNELQKMELISNKMARLSKEKVMKIKLTLWNSKVNRHFQLISNKKIHCQRIKGLTLWREVNKLTKGWVCQIKLKSNKKKRLSKTNAKKKNWLTMK